MAQIESPQARPSTTTTQVLYVLHGLAPFTLWTLAAVAVLIGMVTRDSVRGTYLESHYSWLAQTFWWGLLWLVIATVAFTITVVGIVLLFIPWTILTIWYLYRVIRGWLRLNDGKSAP